MPGDGQIALISKVDIRITMVTATSTIFVITTWLKQFIYTHLLHNL